MYTETSPTQLKSELAKACPRIKTQTSMGLGRKVEGIECRV